MDEREAAGPESGPEAEADATGDAGMDATGEGDGWYTCSVCGRHKQTGAGCGCGGGGDVPEGFDPALIRPDRPRLKITLRPE
jgi:hypothetical protein